MASRTLRILIVEDQFLVARQLEMIVESVGHSVIGIAGACDAACDLASSIDHDVAFIDLSLADGSSGLDVARFVTESCGTPIVFITANHRRIPETYAASSDVVEKPFTRLGILSAVAGVTARIETKRAAHGAP